MDLSKATSIVKPYTITLLADSALMPTPSQAWHEGTNIRSAHNKSPDLIRGWLMSEVGRLCKEMNCKTTISTSDELVFCCRSIMDDHPTLKMEEVRTCFNMIRQGKFGKFYERLKVAELLECLRRYEGEVRTEIMERDVHQQKVQHKQDMVNRLDNIQAGEVLKGLEFEPTKPAEGHGVGSRLRERMDKWFPENG